MERLSEALGNLTGLDLPGLVTELGKDEELLELELRLDDPGPASWQEEPGIYFAAEVEPTSSTPEPLRNPPAVLIGP